MENVRAPAAITCATLAVYFALTTLGRADIQVSWARQFGSSGIDQALAVATDPGRNVVAVGYTDGAVVGNSKGGWDAVISRYSPEGGISWRRQFGTTGDEQATGVATDADGNILVAGFTSGALSGTNKGGYDSFVSKYSPAGTRLWRKQWGTIADDVTTGVATDASGGVIVAGNRSGDGFVLKYSQSGTLLWKRQFGSAGVDTVAGIATDGAGNTIVAGSTFGAVIGTNAGGRDFYLIKYSPTGSLLWKRQVGWAGMETARAVATDHDGNILVAGMSPGPTGTSFAQGAAYLIKLSTDGTILWQKMLGTFLSEALGVAADATSNVFMTGYSLVSLPGATGSGSMFVAKYAPEGSLVTVAQLGNHSSAAISTDRGGQAVLAGYTAGAVVGSNLGADDAFIMKLIVAP